MTPSLLGGILLNFFPESPKFLMSQGRNAEAMRAFQQIYMLNHRKPREDFPVRQHSAYIIIRFITTINVNY